MIDWVSWLTFTALVELTILIMFYLNWCEKEIKGEEK